MKNFKIMILLITLIVVGIFGYYIGIKRNDNQIDTETFYAIIEEINNNTMLVKGLEVNDINHRGKFSFNIRNNTVLEWRYTNIKLSDFKVGDYISITFTGSILESYPAIITDVIRIILLSDELDSITS